MIISKKTKQSFYFDSGFMTKTKKTKPSSNFHYGPVAAILFQSAS